MNERPQGDPEWRARERLRFLSGHYSEPVWRREPFWVAHVATLAPDHFVHISRDDPAMLAYTESAAKGELDRQTRVKPGRYLKKVFGDVLTDQQIAFYAEWWAKGSRPVKHIDGELSFARTESEVLSVYADGPRSCMHGEDCVRVYAAGDLAIAYLHNAERGVFARALCWPDRKVFGRVYPSPDRWDEDGFDSCDDSRAAQEALFGRLKADGYASIEENRQGFNGARLLAVGGYGSGTFVMPYLDGGYGVDFHGDHFTMSSCGEHRCDSTDGEISVHEYTCDQCDEGCDEVYTLHTRWNSAYGWASGEISVCESCEERSGFYCHGSSESFDSDRVESVEVSGQIWALPVAKARAIYDDDLDGWYASEEDRLEARADAGLDAEDEAEDDQDDTQGTLDLEVAA